MDEYSRRQLDAYFQAISGWRDAYRVARLHVLGVRDGETLSVVAARIYLSVGASEEVKEPFRSGRVEAHQFVISEAETAIESVVAAMGTDEGFHAAGCGAIRLPKTDQVGVGAGPLTLLHPEGLNSGHRLAVLTIMGASWTEALPQPETDWRLKGADLPYDSLQEVATEFGVGSLQAGRSIVEVVAHTAVQVLEESMVSGGRATLGIWMAASLDRTMAKLGYRVLDQGRVVDRGAIHGADLRWTERNEAVAGTTELEVSPSAVVQCVASYRGEVHHVQWRTDPKNFLNPRAAVLARIDHTGAILQGYLRPEVPSKGKASEDFEAAVSWLLWALGFAVASFGANAKTRDAFDLVAVSPRSDFLVVECTLGLLRTESKLSRLTARAAGVRDALDAANMKHLRVLPAMVTAMTSEEVKADVPQAEELGVLVLTRESLDQSLNEFVRFFPNADALFERWTQTVRDRQLLRGNKAN